MVKAIEKHVIDSSSCEYILAVTVTAKCITQKVVNKRLEMKHNT